MSSYGQGWHLKNERAAHTIFPGVEEIQAVARLHTATLLEVIWGVKRSFMWGDDGPWIDLNVCRWAFEYNTERDGEPVQ